MEYAIQSEKCGQGVNFFVKLDKTILGCNVSISFSRAMVADIGSMNIKSPGAAGPMVADMGEWKDENEKKSSILLSTILYVERLFQNKRMATEHMKRGHRINGTIRCRPRQPIGL